MAQFWLFDVTNYPGDMSPVAYDPELGATVLAGHLDEWERADELGFDGVYLAEHHFTAYNLTPSPNVLLAAIACRAPRLRIGTMFTCFRAMTSQSRSDSESTKRYPPTRNSVARQ